MTNPLSVLRKLDLYLDFGTPVKPDEIKGMTDVSTLNAIFEEASGVLADQRKAVDASVAIACGDTADIWGYEGEGND